MIQSWPLGCDILRNCKELLLLSIVQAPTWEKSDRCVLLCGSTFFGNILAFGVINFSREKWNSKTLQKFRYNTTEYRHNM